MQDPSLHIDASSPNAVGEKGDFGLNSDLDPDLDDAEKFDLNGTKQAIFSTRYYIIITYHSKKTIEINLPIISRVPYVIYLNSSHLFKCYRKISSDF